VDFAMRFDLVHLSGYSPRGASGLPMGLGLLVVAGRVVNESGREKRCRCWFAPQAFRPGLSEGRRRRPKVAQAGPGGGGPGRAPNAGRRARGGH